MMHGHGHGPGGPGMGGPHGPGMGGPHGPMGDHRMGRDPWGPPPPPRRGGCGCCLMPFVITIGLIVAVIAMIV